MKLSNFCKALFLKTISCILCDTFTLHYCIAISLDYKKHLVLKVGDTSPFSYTRKCFHTDKTEAWILITLCNPSKVPL